MSVYKHRMNRYLGRLENQDQIIIDAKHRALQGLQENSDYFESLREAKDRKRELERQRIKADKRAIEEQRIAEERERQREIKQAAESFVAESRDRKKAAGAVRKLKRVNWDVTKVKGVRSFLYRLKDAVMGSKEHYTPEEKARALRVVIKLGSLSEASRELGIAKSTLSRWRREVLSE